METTDVDEESMEDSGGCECGYDTGQELWNKDNSGGTTNCGGQG